MFDGTDWQTVASTLGPACPAVVAYSQVRHSIVALSLADFVTWQFDGKVWTALGLGDGPTPAVRSGMGRQAPAVDLDEVHDKWVVFGGSDGINALADTWVGDGTSWTLAPGPASPRGRWSIPGRPLMTWEATRNQLVLFGGRGAADGMDLADTWSWGGAAWSQIAGPVYPPPPSSPTPTPSPSPSPNPVVTPTPLGQLPIASAGRLTQPLAISCSGGIGNADPVAVVVLRGQSQPVLRDYADPVHPRTVCTFGFNVFPQTILDPHHILVQVVGPNPAFLYAVVEVPSGTAYEIAVPGAVTAVAPDWSQVLWFNQDGSELHDSWSGGDALIQRYPPAGGRCSNADTDSRPGDFSRNSDYGYAIQNQSPDRSYLNVVGGRASVFSETPPPRGWGAAAGPLFAVWSPVSDTLYYRKLGDVWRWTPQGGASSFKAGVNWIDPSISADGRYIAYMVRAVDATPTVHLMDATTGAVVLDLGSGPRDRPFFLTNNLIWLHGDVQGCTGTTQATYVYDLADHTESPSIIADVWATWPATSALGG